MSILSQGLTAPLPSAAASAIRMALAYAAAFSVFVNLMLLGPTLYMLQVYDRVLTSRSEATLGMLSLGVAIALVAMSVVDAARSRLLVDIGRRIDEWLAGPMLRLVIAAASAPSPLPTGGAVRDVNTLRSFLSGPNVVALFDSPWMLVYGVVIFLFHPVLGGLALAGALTLIALAVTIERANSGLLERLAESNRQSTNFVGQGMRNADVINAMGMTAAFARRWQMLNQNTLNLMQASGGRSGTMLATSKFLRQAIQVLMMGVGAWLVLDSHVTPGIMVASTILFGRAMAPVESLIGNWSGLVAARSAYRRLNKLAPAALAGSQHMALPSPAGRLTLERVALAGRSADAPILRHVEFDLPAGQSLGILGPSGAGKSSLAKLLVGVWPPSAGRVNIDGAEIRQWDPQQLGQRLGYLPQDVELFAGTVAENIARFSQDAGAAVAEAAHRAHAYDMILKLPQGFDTVLGEGGIHLSAGQAQRVGLARALFGQPCLVVLDEPNANLDAEGELALLQTLTELKNDQATVVMVTHKAALVAGMDHLLVLKDGRMELSGPRAHVMEKLAGSPPNALTTSSAKAKT